MLASYLGWWTEPVNKHSSLDWLSRQVHLKKLSCRKNTRSSCHCGKENNIHKTSFQRRYCSWENTSAAVSESKSNIQDRKPTLLFLHLSANCFKSERQTTCPRPIHACVLLFLLLCSRICWSHDKMFVKKNKRTSSSLDRNRNNQKNYQRSRVTFSGH